MKHFRILSLDGGGIKGTFTAAVAANLEKLTGKRLADHFDLITGTSTGGIIALALGLGFPAQEILEFYLNRGPQIFPSTGTGRLVHRLRHAFRHKYSQEVLRGSLEGVFGDKKLGESKCRLVIPAYDCNAGRVQLFKTAHHTRFVQDHRLTATEVAMATAAAPTYFPAFAAPDGQTFLDGGVWANCPIVVGLLEAVFVLNNPPSGVDILSIGTTEVPFDVSKGKRFGGLLTWNRRLVTLLTQAQIDAALAQAQIITGKRAKRIDAVTRPGRFAMDDASQIDALHGLGSCHAKEQVDDVAARFLYAPAEAFVPHHSVFLKADVSRGSHPTPAVARRRRRRSLGLARAGYPGQSHMIANISATGALLETDHEIPVGTLLDLDLELETGMTAKVTAQVVRVQQPRWGSVSGVGVEFIDFRGDARQSVEQYVEAEALALATAMPN